MTIKTILFVHKFSSIKLNKKCNHYQVSGNAYNGNNKIIFQKIWDTTLEIPFITINGRNSYYNQRFVVLEKVVYLLTSERGYFKLYYWNGQVKDNEMEYCAEKHQPCVREYIDGSLRWKPAALAVSWNRRKVTVKNNCSS